MARKEKKMKLWHCGVEGIGKNKTGAKADAERQLCEVVGRCGHVEFRSIGNYKVIIWGTVHGFSYKVMEENEWPRESGVMMFGTSCGTDSFEEVRKKAALHAAQNDWRPEMGLKHPDLTYEENAELESWCEFQIRFQEAKAKGMNIVDAHDYAGRNPIRPELWK